MISKLYDLIPAAVGLLLMLLNLFHLPYGRPLILICGILLLLAYGGKAIQAWRRRNTKRAVVFLMVAIAFAGMLILVWGGGIGEAGVV